MKLRCLLLGCEYKQTLGKVENGIFRIRGKCIHCGKEKVLVQQPWDDVKEMLNVP